MQNKLNLVFLLALCVQHLAADTCVVTTFEEVSEATRTCKDIVISNLTVPGGKTLQLNLTDGATVTFNGTTLFEFYLWKGPLVIINGTGVTIQGDEGHVFYGQGELYWDGLGDWGVPKPQFFTVQTFGGSVIKNIHVVNSPHDVLQITNSANVSYSGWLINNTLGNEDVAPAGKFGKNTDGFDVWNSTHVMISDSVVYNQDDCVAVRSGSYIYVHNLDCHGTHGLSISVGFSNDTILNNPLNTLTNIYFGNSRLYGGENVIHIKTHNEGGNGIIENVFYDNITATGVSNYAILIEENYPNHGEPSDKIPIKNLIITNIHGSVKPAAVAVSVVCASQGCENWYWNNINLIGSNMSNTCNFKPLGQSVCD